MSRTQLECYCYEEMQKDRRKSGLSGQTIGAGLLR